eukprot:TRINITY_DN6652_c0_g1_i1.p1 TRINITY_DN6652_c0_g1~~TRINITY_DN6652_c0_g1_i1.p1  ORF type:complete len:757 (+),score=100.59 TRINITY_DN6652_c0_g1_i1:139-2409(+)
MIKCMEKCLRVDTGCPDEITRKKVVIWFTAVLSPLAVTIIAKPTEDQFRNIFIVFETCVCWYLFARILLRKTISQRHLELLIITLGVVFLVIDFYNVTYGGERMWASFVILFDVLLICKNKGSHIRSILSIMLCTALAIIAIERSARFGLFEFPGSSPTSKRRAMYCDCDNPPCKHPGGYLLAFADQILICAIFWTDYVITRDFARKAEFEQQRLLDGLQLARGIALQLVKFDLNEAEKTLSQPESKNNVLHQVLQQLLANLRIYRPYLPDSMFSGDPCDPLQSPSNGTGNNRIEINPPGMESGEAAIVFTDIQSSSELWEEIPEDMAEALLQHNATIRNCIFANDGYEVKTIGDAFMVAFFSFEQACRFSLAVIENLKAVTWPRELLTYQGNDGTMRNLNGLPVRIGCHAGELRLERNPLTQRYDYMGSTVNKAARLEHSGKPSSLTIIESMAERANLPEGLTRIPLGSINLKGIGSEQLLSIYPASSSNVHSSSIVSRLESRSDVSSVVSSVEDIPSKGGCSYRRHKNVTIARFDLMTSGSGWSILEKLFGSSLNAISRTNGVVVAVYHDILLASWNATKSCSSHLESAFKCHDLIQNSCKYHECSKAICGISNGSIESGTIGNVNQRFVTCSGSCVRLCDVLCEAAREVGAVALHACVPFHSYSAESEPSLAGRIVPIDVWNIVLCTTVNSPATGITIFEIRAEGEGALDATWGTFNLNCPKDAIVDADVVSNKLNDKLRDNSTPIRTSVLYL